MSTRLALMVLGVLAVPGTAFGYAFAPAEIPNGTRFSCQTCHTGASGGRGWNAFGNQIIDLGAINLGTRTVDWAAIYDLDADEDGFSNGAELGDPDGDGVATPGAQVTRPGDASSFPDPCGNGALDEGEVCDGTTFADAAASCETEGFAGGELGCSADCSALDTSNCTSDSPDAGSDAGGTDAGSDTGGDTGGADAGGGDDTGAGEDVGGGDDSGSPGGDDTGAGSDSGGGTGDDTGAGGDAGGETDAGAGAGGEEEAEDEGGCSATGTSGQGSALMMGLGILGLLFGRRRQMVRR